MKRRVVCEVISAMESDRIIRAADQSLAASTTSRTSRQLNLRESAIRSDMLRAIADQVGVNHAVSITATAKAISSAFASLVSVDFRTHEQCSDFGLHVMGFLMKRAELINVGRLSCERVSVRMEFYGWAPHRISLPTGMMAMMPNHFEAILNINLQKIEFVVPQSSAALLTETVGSMWMSIMSKQSDDVVGMIALDEERTKAMKRKPQAPTTVNPTDSDLRPSAASQSAASALDISANAASSNLALTLRTEIEVELRALAASSRSPSQKVFLTKIAEQLLATSNADLNALLCALRADAPVLCVFGSRCHRDDCLRLHDERSLAALDPHGVQALSDRIRKQGRTRRQHSRLPNSAKPASTPSSATVSAERVQDSRSRSRKQPDSSAARTATAVAHASAHRPFGQIFVRVNILNQRSHAQQHQLPGLVQHTPIRKGLQISEL